MLPDESEQIKEEPGDSSEPEQTEDSTAEPKKQPAGWLPERPNRKKPVPFFVEEPDREAATSPFLDKRYETYRKQMAVGLGVAVLCVVLFSVLFWFRSETLFFESPVEPVVDSSAVAAAGLTAEQSRQLRLDTLREQLQESAAARNWSAVDQLANAVLKMEPADGEAWNFIALMNEKNSKTQEALEAYTKVIDAKFVPSFALMRRAAMHRLLGNYPAAIADLQEAARQDPQSIAVPNLILIYQIQAGEAKEARKVVDRFDVAGLESMASQYLLGKAALALHDGDTAKAAALFTQFQAMVPPEIFSELIEDPFFTPYRNEVALLPFYLSN